MKQEHYRKGGPEVLVGYVAYHVWMRNNYGNASKCEYPGCKRYTKYFEWALLKGKKYEHKRENYWMLCKSCHTKYDLTDEARQKLFRDKFPKGHIPWNKGKVNVYSEEMLRKMSEARRGQERMKRELN